VTVGKQEEYESHRNKGIKNEMEKSLVSFAAVIYSNISLLLLSLHCFLIFPVLCVLQLRLCTYTLTPVIHVILKPKAEIAFSMQISFPANLIALFLHFIV